MALDSAGMGYSANERIVIGGRPVNVDEMLGAPKRHEYYLAKATEAKETRRFAGTRTTGATCSPLLKRPKLTSRRVVVATFEGRNFPWGSGLSFPLRPLLFPRWCGPVRAAGWQE